jgi:mono/diheme cytochrome c family protein
MRNSTRWSPLYTKLRRSLHTKLRRSLRAAIFSASLIFVMSPTAWAQADLGDVDRGHDLARTTCTACHRVEKGQTAEKIVDVPSFQTVANNKRRTGLALLVFLKSPHANMPDIVLAEKEIDNVIAYIMSLKPGAD